VATTPAPTSSRGTPSALFPPSATSACTSCRAKSSSSPARGLAPPQNGWRKRFIPKCGAKYLVIWSSGHLVIGSSDLVVFGTSMDFDYADFDDKDLVERSFVRAVPTERPNIFINSVASVCNLSN